ncbi:TetR family transcriptional regulator [Stappia sp. GBMRC 2046]|uniref:TetR family transcriptional regulator n=1 Tax=Stappia sediminis TaxID=2692190 RepID=A0A7X3LTA8_9HYPH|nr:TetR/AcrR family transcriptional regulator [Stappia sediminis]MXN64715.1 TetR family transcriptional regulator [Stappia sediminis]
MSKKATRDEIIAAADDLFYRQGFEKTSFADIAGVVNISRGNFYHHFKTKDEILDAVIEKRLADRQAMMEKWEIEGETPEDRIRSFIDILIVNGEKIKRYGCPIGTLTSELAKLNHAAQGEANKLFTVFRTWLKRQFEMLGREDDADELAMHLLARSQGAATLANAYQDDAFIARELESMYAWLSGCAAGANKRERAEM